MDTSKIRDKILEQRALYQQSKQVATEEAEKIRNIISGISEDEQSILKEVLGNDYFDLTTIDLERVKTDAKYLHSCQSAIDTAIDKLHKHLEAEIGV